jgi:hypothetical protein
MDEDTAPLPPRRSSSPTARVSRIQSKHTSHSLTPSSPHIRSRSERTSPSLRSERTNHIRNERILSTPTLRGDRTTPVSSLTARSLIRSDHMNCSMTPASSSRGHFQSERMTPSSPRSETNGNSLAPPRERNKLPPAPFRQGCTPGPKPKAVDYEEGIEKMLLNAMHEYACLVLAVDAFPDEVKQTRWAKSTWHTACEAVGAHYECSPHMIRLVRLGAVLSLRAAC